MELGKMETNNGRFTVEVSISVYCTFKMRYCYESTSTVNNIGERICPKKCKHVSHKIKTTF